MNVTIVFAPGVFSGVVTTFADVCTELRLRGHTVELYMLYPLKVEGWERAYGGRQVLTDALRRFTPCRDVHVLPHTAELVRRLMAKGTQRGPVVVDRTALLALRGWSRELGPGRPVLLYPLLVRAARGLEPWTLAEFNDLLTTHRVVTVGNRVNRRWATGGEYVHWPVGLARARVDLLRRLSVDRRPTLTTDEYNAVRNRGALTAFEHRRYVYRRREVGPGLTYENIGKLLFEFLLCGKTVHYSPVGKLMDDGLTEMLARVGVDDAVEQELTVPMDVLESTLLDAPFDQLSALLTRL